MTGKSPAGDDKEKRLAAALRENLKRRKAQARGRAEAAETSEDAAKDGLPPQSRGD